MDGDTRRLIGHTPQHCFQNGKSFGKHAVKLQRVGVGNSVLCEVLPCKT